MKAYGIDFPLGLFLAPLSGYTDWPLRMLCRRYGAELAYTEMISAAGLLRNTANTRTLLVRPVSDRPLIAQIFTSSPQDAAQAARLLEQEGFDGININMGCPVRKVVTKGCGAALMRDPEIAVRLTEAVLEAVRLPVSVKMRAGWDSASLNAHELARDLARTGVDCITIHPRTRTDMYRGEPRWEEVPRIRGICSLPLIVSGNIRGEEDLTRLKGLGADACMIGRGAIGRPWIFRELTGQAPPSLTEQREVMLLHLHELLSLYGPQAGLRHMRKFLSAYVKGLPHAAHFRQQACQIDDAGVLERSITDFFDTLEGR